MKKIITAILFTALLFPSMLWGNQNSQQKGNSTETEVSETAVPEEIIAYEKEHAEEIAHMEALTKKVIDYIKVVDNRFVFVLSEEESAKIGLSKEDYQLVVKAMSDNNEFIEIEGITNVAEMFEEFRQKYSDKES